MARRSRTDPKREADAAKAYACLKKLKEKDELKGMGPAFFTTLIYFLTPRDKPERDGVHHGSVGAASSVNLLTGSKMVQMDVTPNSRSGRQNRR